jgi:predicted nucleotidyltransferase
MGKRESQKITGILEKLLAQKEISADKIVVFGSRSRGNYQPDSDIDIIIISRNFEKKGIFERVAMASGIHRQLVKKINIPVDLLYFSPSEWEKGDSLIAASVRQDLAA